MIFYLVYDAALGSPTARPVLRWGECPEDMLAAQAVEADDVAVEIASLAPFDDLSDGDFATEAEFFYTFDPAAETVATVTRAAATDYLAARVLNRIQNALNETAWTQTIEGAFTDGRVQDWLTYRKAVREVPLQPGFPSSITWPTPPSAVENDTDPLWTRFYRRGNIIGPVSKTAGLMPTGALIEEGANANGRYRRLAGGLGTQFCWHRMASSDSGDVTWTFPAAFSGDNLSFSLTPVVTAGLVIMAPIVRPVSATSVSFSIVNASGTRIVRTCDLFAIGQWS